MKRLLVSLLSSSAVALALVGCGSSVKLSDVPVEDRAGASVGQASGATAAGVAGSGVAPVEIGRSDANAAGPAGTARVIFFDYDSFSIKPEFQSVIEAHARFLSANKSRRVAVEGHTDERGGREYNLALGQKRAEAVRRALGLLGVSDAQIEAVSFGEEKATEAGGTEEAFARNRRAELSYR